MPTDDEPAGDEPAGNTLMVPFLNLDPVYAFGVEFGQLYAEMRAPDPEPIERCLTRTNQDQVLLAASRLGWTVDEIKKQDRHWFWIRMSPPA